MKWIKFDERKPKHDSLILLFRKESHRSGGEGYYVCRFDSHNVDNIQSTGFCCTCDVHNEDIIFWSYFDEVKDE